MTAPDVRTPDGNRALAETNDKNGRPDYALAPGLPLPRKRPLHDLRGLAQAAPPVDRAAACVACAMKAPAEHLEAADADRKREATATALLAIHRGHEVHRLQGGEYLVTWRGVSRHCRDLAELEQHAQRVGAMR